MQPKQYKVGPRGLKELRRKTLLTIVPILVIAVVIGLSISHSNSRGKDLSTLFITIPLMVLFLFYSIYSSLKRKIALFKSYTLTVDGATITREQMDTPTISIQKWDITDVIRAKNNWLTIKTYKVQDVIMVPPHIEGYMELKDQLESISPINTKARIPILQRYVFLFTLFVLGLLVLVFITTDKILLTLSGTLVTGILIWCLYEGRRSKNIDQRTKNGLWWLLFILLAVVSRVVVVLLGYQ
jgi:hypothetical protein